MQRNSTPLNAAPTLPAFSPPAQAGFTLIELMVTLTVMAIVMTVLLKATSGQQDQLRYNQTVERVERIKKAIVDVSSVNGVPAISGFVADMGRLPRNIHELLEKDYCPSDITAIVPGSLPASCSTGEAPVSNVAWQSRSICQDATLIDPSASPPVAACPNSAYIQATLTGGWNGPYLQTSTTPSHVDSQHPPGSDAFADGWGNEGFNPPPGYPAVALNPDPRHNYGWFFSNTYVDSNGASQTGVLLYSYGDGCYLDATMCKGSNVAGLNYMDFGYPPPQPASPSITPHYIGGMAHTADPNLSETPLMPPAPIVSSAQWQVVIGDSKNGSAFTSGTGVNVTLMPSQPTTSLCLNLYFIKDGTPAVVSSDRYRASNGIYKGMNITAAGSSPMGIAAVGSLPQTFTFAFPPNSSNLSEPVSIPIGNAAFSVHNGGCLAVEDSGTVTVTGVSPSTYGSTGITYPEDGRQAVPVKILPGQTPSFVW